MNWEAVGMVAVVACLIIVSVTAIILYVRLVLYVSDKYDCGLAATLAMTFGPFTLPLLIAAYIDHEAFYSRSPWYIGRGSISGYGC
jgi:hypothetical protein